MLFIATLAIGNSFVASDKAVSRKSAGHDFLAFYTAGTFVRTGRSAELYDLAAVKTFEPWPGPTKLTDPAGSMIVRRMTVTIALSRTPRRYDSSAHGPRTQVRGSAGAT